MVRGGGLEFIFAGIDGTSPLDDKKYAEEFANSFVKRLYDHWPFPHLATYVRGPKNAGNETGSLASHAYQHVRGLYAPNRGVVLAGYSRGAAAVIQAAARMSRWHHKPAGERANEEKDIPVHCLILFDSVDRTITVGGLLANTPITKNVWHCIHAIRDESTGSRSEFGGCGTEIQDPQATHYVSRHFYGTHGALGGVPWKVKPHERVDERTDFEKRHDLSIVTSVTKVTGAHESQAIAAVWSWVMDEYGSARAQIERKLLGGK